MPTLIDSALTHAVAKVLRRLDVRGRRHNGLVDYVVAAVLFDRGGRPDVVRRETIRQLRRHR